MTKHSVSKIRIAGACALNEAGKRSNNEDAVFPGMDTPKQALLETKAFLVCDGVGGLEKGEEASRIVAAFMGEQFANETALLDEHALRNAVRAAEDRVCAFAEKHHVSGDLATTLAMVHIGSHAVSVVHLGDSRVYQFRQGQMVFKTQDHSFVNELVEGGLLSPEEALVHPKRNVVTRAISSGTNRHEPELNRLQDVRDEDLFIICSDGVTEGLSDEALGTICTEEGADPARVIQAIDAQCREKSKDNYTAYVLRLAVVESPDQETSTPQRDAVHPNTSTPKQKPSKSLLAGAGALVVAGVAWGVFSSGGADESDVAAPPPVPVALPDPETTEREPSAGGLDDPDELIIIQPADSLPGNDTIPPQ